jgi:adducin
MKQVEIKKWKIGELEFECLMRILDNAGFRTGYVYRQPLIRTIDKTTTFKDVEVPPAASSATSFVEQTHPEAYSPTRQAQRTTEWRNSPNAYLKQEIEETGTPNPKKVTKWVPDTGLKHSTPIKIDTKHQFAPSNVDPKELKSHQKQIKEDRFNEKISAGYQSKILENAAWDDVTQMKEPHQPSAETVVVVGAASKGIIKRDQQNNAIVYKTYYGQNPFAHMDNDEIEKYKREVEQNQMREQGGDSQYDDHSDSRGRSPQTVHSHHLTTPEKNITLPRSTASGHKVATSKSDTMKSTTSSSAGSSREVSPNRTSGSKGGGEEIKKEKKSKFRTPSFLRKRKEKKEAAAKEKAEKEKAEK